MTILPPWLRFAVVGTVGFVVDAGVLLGLIEAFGAHPVLARGISVPVAVWATWYLNRRFTFEARGDAWGSFLRYVVVSLGGAGVNVATYAALMFSSSTFATRPLAALAVASVVALVFNYLGSKHFAFRRRV
ncbi:GtrA family protein [Ramlibacter sp. AW1]|uniref:GtrA family protein n=1 Tax=Ramlibacter aurantiacus TaxID=2801330 RepID=A0A936ZT16_9BURK|nr:GtrA family protein [Ramlibacter aurantiacus]MBL0422943.1 GtrA family protein [Ramlibacter aurantiacus]